MFLLNNILWLIVCLFTFNVRSSLDVSSNDLISTNDFVPSHYDLALALWIGGAVGIWLWMRLSLLFYSGYQKWRLSFVEKWLIQNVGLWLYVAIGIGFYAPLVTQLPAFPVIFVIENLGFHLGDYLMPAVFWVVGGIVGIFV